MTAKRVLPKFIGAMNKSKLHSPDDLLRLIVHGIGGRGIGWLLSIFTPIQSCEMKVGHNLRCELNSSTLLHPNHGLSTTSDQNGDITALPLCDVKKPPSESTELPEQQLAIFQSATADNSQLG